MCVWSNKSAQHSRLSPVFGDALTCLRQHVRCCQFWSSLTVETLKTSFLLNCRKNKQQWCCVCFDHLHLKMVVVLWIVLHFCLSILMHVKEGPLIICVLLLEVESQSQHTSLCFACLHCWQFFVKSYQMGLCHVSSSCMGVWKIQSAQSFDLDWVAEDRLTDLGACTHSNAPDEPPMLTAARSGNGLKWALK